MPNTNRIIGQFLPTGNPATMKVAVNVQADLYAAGQVGCTFDLNGNTYTIVLVEPAVTALLTAQVLYWKDTGNTGNPPTVTNVLANAIGGATSALSQVAGVSLTAFATTGVLGTLICIATGVSKNISVQIDAGSTVAAGSPLTASTTVGCLALVVAQVTPQVGVSRGAKSGSPSVALCDLNIPTLA